MKIKILFKLLLPGMAIVLAGCQVGLKHGQFKGGTPAAKGSMAVSSQAQNMNRRIGSGTFTAFAIPIAPVTVNGEADRELMTQVREAVEHCGYGVKMVENPGEAAGLPLLSCNVEQFAFKNYTYFVPIVFNWGTIQLNLMVANPDGRIVWYRSYSGHANGAYSFQSTVNTALTRALNQMIPDLTAADWNAPAGRICPALKAADPDEVVHTLKVLRKLNAPDVVPEILPLLHSKNSNVVRDSCRTLAVLGNNETIPSIEPLLQDRRSDVRKDAQDALNKLRNKL